MCHSRLEQRGSKLSVVMLEAYASTPRKDLRHAGICGVSVKGLNRNWGQEADDAWFPGQSASVWGLQDPDATLTSIWKRREATRWINVLGAVVLSMRPRETFCRSGCMMLDVRVADVDVRDAQFRGARGGERRGVRAARMCRTGEDRACRQASFGYPSLRRGVRAAAG